MEGLLTFLFLGLCFFLMMRMHMGHGAHGSHSDNTPNHTDPVCGMQVDPTLGYGRMYQGVLYRFCSRNCLDKFDANPVRFANGQVEHQEHINHE